MQMRTGGSVHMSVFVCSSYAQVVLLERFPSDRSGMASERKGERSNSRGGMERAGEDREKTAARRYAVGLIAVMLSPHAEFWRKWTVRHGSCRIVDIVCIIESGFCVPSHGNVTH